MDLNTSESFFGDIASTSTPVQKATSTSNEGIVGSQTSDLRKRKLNQSIGESLPTKHMRLSNSFAELECISTESDCEVVDNTATLIHNETTNCERTLIPPDSTEFASREDGEVSGEEECSRYETISETYCNTSEMTLTTLSSISNIPLDSSESNDSVVFVSEKFPSYVQTVRSSNGDKKRMIIIDGSNVAFTHSLHRKEFSVEGIRICIDHFIKQGFDVKAVVPQMRLKRCNSTNSELLEQLRDEGKVIISPCKSLPNGRSIVSYDDRFILDLAHKFDGVVISNDNFRYLFNENDAYKRIIQGRVIGYMFCNDTILFPKDPYGRDGPTSDEILIRTKSSKQ